MWLWLHAALALNCVCFKGIKIPFVIVQASHESMKGFYKRHASKGCQLAQLDVVLYKRFTAVWSEVKPVTGTSVMGLLMMQLK